MLCTFSSEYTDYSKNTRVNPIWFIYSILSAFFVSLSDLFVKKYSTQLGPSELALGRVIYSLPILWAFAFMNGIPAISSGLFWACIIGVPVECAAILLYMKSLSISPLSLTVPFLSFTPVFLLITSPLIVGEYPSIAGVSGIIIIVTGAYFLNLSSREKGLLYPFRMIWREKGSWMMLLVAFLYSITSNLGKLGIMSSSPSFFAAVYFTLLACVLAVLVAIKGRLRSIIRKELLVIGSISSLMTTCQMIALSLVYVSYMISVKRASLLFGIMFGHLFFGEEDLKEKLFGGLLMIAGIAVIALAG